MTDEPVCPLCGRRITRAESAPGVQTVHVEHGDGEACTVAECVLPAPLSVADSEDAVALVDIGLGAPERWVRSPDGSAAVDLEAMR